MKPQDILFIIVFIALLITCRKRSSVFVWAGITCLAVSIPLFSFWIFFTAQRLVYYASGFILVGIIVMLAQERTRK